MLALSLAMLAAAADCTAVDSIVGEAWHAITLCLAAYALNKNSKHARVRDHLSCRPWGASKPSTCVLVSNVLSFL